MPEGTREHWPLEKNESADLVKRIEGVLAMLPKRKRTALSRVFEKFGPPALLAFSAYMITVPRIQLTRFLLAQQRANTTRNNAQSIPTPIANGNSGPDEPEPINVAGSHRVNRQDRASADTSARINPLDANVANLAAV